MNIRKITVVLAVVILVGAILASRFLTSQPEKTEDNKGDQLTEIIPKVKVLKVKNQNLEAPLVLTGRLIAPEKVEVFSEVGGMLLPGGISFKEGNRFAKNTPLINIDAEEAKMGLLAQKSALLNTITQMMPDLKLDYPQAYPQWLKYLDNFELEAPVPPFPDAGNQKEKYFYCFQKSA